MNIILFTMSHHTYDKDVSKRVSTIAQ